MAGFAPIETPNFAAAALGGYQAGRAIGKQRREDAGLQLYGTDPEAGINALELAGSPLAEQLRKNRDARELRNGYAALYTPESPALGGTQSDTAAPAALGAPAAPSGAAPELSPEANAMVAPQAPVAPPAAPANGPTANGLPVNMAALQRLASLGTEGAKGAQVVYGLIEEGNKARIAAFTAHAEMRGQIAMYLKTLPPERRAQAYQESLPELQARGFIPEAIQGMRFDDEILNRDVALSMTTVQSLAQANSDRTFNAGQEERRADNARGDRGLAVREGALGLARSRAAGGGKAGGGAGDNSDLNYLLGGN